MYYLPQPKIDVKHIEDGLKKYWEKSGQISKNEYEDLKSRLEFYQNILDEAGCQECARLLRLYKSSAPKQRDRKMTEVCYVL